MRSDFKLFETSPPLLHIRDGLIAVGWVGLDGGGHVVIVWRGTVRPIFSLCFYPEKLAYTTHLIEMKCSLLTHASSVENGCYLLGLGTQHMHTCILQVQIIEMIFHTLKH